MIATKPNHHNGGRPAGGRHGRERSPPLPQGPTPSQSSETARRDIEAQFAGPATFPFCPGDLGHFLREWITTRPLLQRLRAEYVRLVSVSMTTFLSGPNGSSRTLLGIIQQYPDFSASLGVSWSSESLGMRSWSPGVDLELRNRPHLGSALEDFCKAHDRSLALRARLAHLFSTAFAEESWRWHLGRSADSTTSLLIWLRTLISKGRRFEPNLADAGWIERYAAKYLILSSEGRAEKWLKWATADTMARLLADPSVDSTSHDLERPPRPDWLPPTEKHFLGGPAYVWFESACQGPDRIRLAGCVGMLKKRQPTVSESFVDSAKKEWESALFGRSRPTGTSFRDSPAGFVPSLSQPHLGLDMVLPPPRADRPYEEAWANVAPQPLRDLVRRECDMIARAIAHSFRTVRAPKVPGVKARNADPGGGPEFNRQYGGELGSHQLALAESISPEWAAGFLAHLKGQPRPRPAHFLIEGRPYLLAAASDLTGSMELQTLVPPALDTLLGDQTWVDYVSLDAGIDVLHSPILEPFKVRHITASPARLQRTLHDLQASLHESMTRLPPFRLSHETPGVGLLELANLYLAPHFREGHQWVSGDYTASTDNLDPEVSEIAANALCRALGLSARVRHLFVAGLTRHRYNGTPQKWGQLMGSVISFPVLCIANLALTLVAFRLAGRPVTNIHRCGVLINGDDIGFSATSWVRTVWRLVTSAGGLSPSVGKNFVNGSFLQLNSQMLLWDPKAPRIAYSSSGPEAGLFRLASCPQLAVLAPPPEGTKEFIGRRLFLSQAPGIQRRFLDGFAGLERDQLNRLWLATWSSELVMLTPYSREVNWFLPRVLGGFGLEAPSDHRVRINEGQLRAAAYLRDHTDLSTWDRVRLGLAAGPPATTAHDDAKGLLRGLTRYVRPVWSDRPGPDPLGGLESALAFSGASGYWFPRKATSAEAAAGVLEPPRVCMRIRATGTGFALSVDEQPARPPPSLVRWSRDLRRFSRSTRRMMDPDEALGFRKQLVLELADGATFAAGGLRTDVCSLTTARLPLTVSGPGSSALAALTPVGLVALRLTPSSGRLIK